MTYKLFEKPTPELTELFKQWGQADERAAARAGREFTQGLTMPLRQGVLKGDILANIYEVEHLEKGQYPEYPLDMISPGTEHRYMAYTIPYTGRIPERHVSGDYLMVPTYRVGNSIDWDIRFTQVARWNVLGRAMQVMEAGFVLKANIDGWQTIISAGKGRNIVVYDAAASAGLFTKRLVLLMENLMRRYAGGNSTSVSRGKMTDIFVSPEAHGDVLTWDLTQVPESVRTQIWSNWGKGGLTQIGPVLIHDIDELGVGQSFQAYYDTTLGGTMGSSDVEIVVGLDLDNRDSFVNPVKQEVELFEDMSFHRAGRAGIYGHREGGYSVLDARRVLIGSF